jgi:opacity protein-like surface antigen
MKLKTLVAGIVMAVATPLAMAEGSGLYVALDVGQSKFKDLCQGFSGSCKDTDTALRGALGYQINQYIGVEGAYVEAGKSTASAPGFSGEAKLTDWQLVAVGTLPVGGGFSLIAKAGADHWSSNITATGGDASGSGTSFLWGAGGQFDFNRSVGVRAQYETRKAGDINKPEGLGNVSMLSVGVVLRF